ncbi:MAG: exodeoxyribonuclease V subunit alpha [Edaphocola sp.]
MHTTNDVHLQFAQYFNAPALLPYLYLLSLKMSEGHICIETKQLDKDALPESLREKKLSDKLAEQALVGTCHNDAAPFVLHHDKLYLQRYFRYETMLLQKIRTMIECERGLWQERAALLQQQANFIRQLFYTEQSHKPDWQLAAAVTAVSNNFTIITGGPGTGKTTTVAKILAILYTLYPHLNVALAAPTGKAAARMAESLASAKIEADDPIKEKLKSLKPFTIHRLLGWQKGSPYFRHHADFPLPHDLVIVDESSMIDMALFAKLLSAIRNDARIILLGDKDQLASVEAGSLYGDLCNALPSLNEFGKTRLDLINSLATGAALPLAPAPAAQHLLFEHLVALQYSHRFSDEKGIGKLSKAVIENDENTLKKFLENNEEQEIDIDQTYGNAIFESYINGFKEYIEEKDTKIAIEKFNKLRVLCAVRIGEQGVANMNNKIEKYLMGKGLIKRGTIFYENRPIMVTQNDYTLGLYNGDVGILRSDKDGTMKAWFLDNSEPNKVTLKAVLPGFIQNMETVFAMTIHKSQGSEFDSVLIEMPQHNQGKILTRELLYTAITRARKKVILRTTAQVLLSTAESRVQRGSGVAGRLGETSQQQHKTLNILP